MGKDHPDADLHPEATGPAALTVKVHDFPVSIQSNPFLPYFQAHSTPSPLKLYSGWFCPFVQRIWLALEEKSLPYTYIEVNPYHKPASLLTLNPRGLVPTLEYDGKPLYESSVLVEFLEDAYPECGVRLFPGDAYARARSRIWIDFVGSRIVGGYHRFLQHQGEDGLSAKRDEFLGYLEEYTKAMDPEGPFFNGKHFGAVDVALAPWAVRLWVFDHFKGGLGIPEVGKGGEDEGVWERWRVWSRAVEGRESVVKTMSEREHYLPIYQRYAEDRAQSELAKATRAGRGVP